MLALSLALQSTVCPHTQTGRCAFFFLIARESPPQLFADLLQLRYASEALYVLDEAPGLFFFTTYAALLWSWSVAL